jgi:ABC-type branched-subunit amino acid transport system ATPase component
VTTTSLTAPDAASDAPRHAADPATPATAGAPVAATPADAPREGAGTAPGAPPPPAVLDARAAHVRGARGAVFGPLDATSAQPVTVVLGDRGSGRTSFLLATAGRMRLTSGRLTVLGRDTSRASAGVRRRAGIAGFDGIDDLEPVVPVGAVVRERLSWESPWYRRTPRVTAARLAALLGPVLGDVPVPDPGLLVRDLSEAQDLLVRVALALLSRPEVLVVDDLDAVKNPHERAVVARCLEALTDPAHPQHVRAVVLGSADPRDVHLLTPDRTAVVTLTR